MFGKLSLFIDVFRKGSEVANAEAWKTGQITGTLVGGLIIALANISAAYSHPLPIDTGTANVIGAGIVAFANVLLTAATSKRAGLLPAKPEPDSAEPEPMPEVVQADAPTSMQPQLKPGYFSSTGDNYTGG